MKRISPRMYTLLRIVPPEGMNAKAINEEYAKGDFADTFRTLKQFVEEGYLYTVKRTSPGGQLVAFYLRTELADRLLHHFQHGDFSAGYQQAWRRIKSSEQPDVVARPEVWPGVRYIIDTPRVGVWA